MQDKTHDVVIVGAGPVGLALGRMLGLRGHDVTILERWPEPYPLPRAVHFDDEIGRVFQSMNLTEEIKAISEAVPDYYEWRNAAGESLVKIDWSGTGPSGWPTASFFSQPQLEKVLDAAVEEMPNVTLLRGAEVVGIDERADNVEVTFTSTVVKQRQMSARYVIGCDGANSFVRERMGATMHDQGFFFDWLIVDTIPLDDRTWAPQNWQLCDPTRPTTVVSGGPGRRRWEFMRLPGETRDELNTPEKAWELLAAWDRTPENSELERHAVYTFAARWADRWNAGRLALAGDAAHQMPPFAGQGMCSGIRDAANLSWKLDRVLRGESDLALLDSYTSERREHLQHAITMSVELGRVICVLDEKKAAERDTRMIAGGADPAKVLPVTALPVLGKGVTAQSGDVAALRGTLAPQFPVRANGREQLLDEATGYGGVLLVRSDAAAQPDPGLQTLLVDTVVHLVTVGDHGAPNLHDVTGTWSHWFDGNGIEAVLIRPDHYIFAAVTDSGQLPGLLAEYRDRLRVTIVPTVSHPASTSA
ncbi:bifunctional 3-(3-hydroxy-phenyl)propionate/3-hydroxycinnamic acid hydroxylase MhpA [Rhodococcus artemisiae]|uniref:Bifunctional 3-(3-hydroxy-phenyl)propionate/3-hydroxycinnamic acid hydroxylase n=1 Tax=Rhodococcus artemisiae TaxID=714159 RepID=A0ABU7L954_9NOCA|nr:bifunctional 3-(3-hydroxy-phenyl)propionate/3-hydroxycinnamic acid hydroxylase [Rhodococcus artemisiae]MEE2058081.1 bifunctional 3-(3-hydroxy-phenyl)propionate/3-hydroxycinnamic acid hydroxylase [Rhodococcus artemisiae]